MNDMENKNRNVMMVILIVIIAILATILVCVLVIKSQNTKNTGLNSAGSGNNSIISNTVKDNTNTENVNNTNNTNNNQSSNNNNSAVANEDKVINLTDANKQNILDKNTYNIAFAIKCKGRDLLINESAVINSGNFTDDEKVIYIINALRREDKLGSYLLKDANGQYTKFSDIQMPEDALVNFSKSYFNEPININNLTDKSVLRKDRNLVTLNAASELGMSPAMKIKSLKFNESTNIYTLEIVEIKESIAKNNPDYCNNSKTSYNESDIFGTYTFKAKKSGSNYLLSSLSFIKK